MIVDTSALIAILHDELQRYGKGRHPAGLNFGDCCSYALAQACGEPLRFKGADFGQTDIVAHPASR